MIERESCLNCKHRSKEPQFTEKKDPAFWNGSILYAYLCNKGRGRLYVWSKNELNEKGCSAWEKVEEPQQISIFELLEEEEV